MKTTARRTSAPTLVADASVWTQTSGAASPWQLTAGSDASFLYLPDLDTRPFEALVELPVPLMINAPVDLDTHEDEEQLPLFVPEEPLRQSLLNLLRFQVVPDEPSDSDIAPAHRYRMLE